MARHHKSPGSRRNLMVIDPLTPSQIHQFNFSVYPGLLLIPFNLICHMTMFRKLNFWPLPKAPGGGDPKKWDGVCAIHVSNSHTKSSLISGFFFWPPPPPPMVTLSPTPGHDPGGRMKIPSDMLYIFHLWEDTQNSKWVYQEILQSQTADNPVAPRGRAAQPPGWQIKQSNQLSLPHQDDCNTRADTKQRATKHRTITDGNSKQKVNNNRTTALERTAA